jgi:hypothetical protein
MAAHFPNIDFGIGWQAIAILAVQSICSKGQPSIVPCYSHVYSGGIAPVETTRNIVDGLARPLYLNDKNLIWKIG